MKTNNANLDTLPRSIPQVQTMHAIADAFPAPGHHGDGRRPRPGRPSRPATAPPCSDLETTAGRHARLRAGRTRRRSRPRADGQTQRLTLPIPCVVVGPAGDPGACSTCATELVPDALGRAPR